MLYDISPPLNSQIGVWPGDSPLTRETILDIQHGANLTLSTLRTTVHVGAHADAPSHYESAGVSIAECPLEAYLGECQIVRVAPDRGTRVHVAAMLDPIVAPRVLFSTGTFPNASNFNTDFAGLGEDLIDYLGRHGVVLVGVDTPSLDLFDSKSLPAHKAAYRHRICILEGLLLAEVPEGVYELVALPLRLVGFDASPVRAILRSMNAMS